MNKQFNVLVIFMTLVFTLSNYHAKAQVETECDCIPISLVKTIGPSLIFGTTFPNEVWGTLTYKVVKCGGETVIFFVSAQYYTLAPSMPPPGTYQPIEEFIKNQLTILANNSGIVKVKVPASCLATATYEFAEPVSVFGEVSNESGVPQFQHIVDVKTMTITQFCDNTCCEIKYAVNPETGRFEREPSEPSFCTSAPPDFPPSKSFPFTDVTGGAVFYSANLVVSTGCNPICSDNTFIIDRGNNKGVFHEMDRTLKIKRDNLSEPALVFPTDVEERIQINTIEPIVEISVLDIQGIEIKQVNNPISREINVTDLRKGIYFIVLKTINGKYLYAKISKR